MRRSIFAIALFVATALPSSTARAASPFLAWTGCGGTEFNTCVRVTADSVYELQGSREGAWVKLVVTNDGAAEANSYLSYFTAFGLYNTGYDLGTPFVVGAGSAGSGWKYKDGVSRFNNFGVTYEGTVDGAGDPAVVGVAPGGTVTFFMSIVGTRTATGPARFALHGQGGPRGCSTKLQVIVGSPYSYGYLGGVGAVDACTDPPITTTVTPPTTVTPEPASLALVASGLLGLAAVARRRKPVAR